MSRWIVIHKLSRIHSEMEEKRGLAREYRDKLRSTIDDLDRMSEQMERLEAELRELDFIRFCNTPCSRF